MDRMGAPPAAALGPERGGISGILCAAGGVLWSVGSISPTDERTIYPFTLAAALLATGVLSIPGQVLTLGWLRLLGAALITAGVAALLWMVVAEWVVFLVIPLIALAAPPLLGVALAIRMRAASSRLSRLGILISGVALLGLAFGTLQVIEIAPIAWASYGALWIAAGTMLLTGRASLEPLSRSLTLREARRFVCGESNWASLAGLGVAVVMHGDWAEVHCPPDLQVIRVDASDVAVGFLENLGRGSLTEWAQVLLASTFIDLDDLHARPEGEALLAAVWDAAGGRSVSADGRLAAEVLSGKR